MSEPFEPNPYVSGGTAVLDPDPTIAQAPRVDRGTRKPSPLDNIKPELPRTHPVTYLAVGLATLALLLSIFAISRGGDGGGFRRVKVNGQDCVIQMTGDTDALFCAAGPQPS